MAKLVITGARSFVLAVAGLAVACASLHGQSQSAPESSEQGQSGSSSSKKSNHRATRHTTVAEDAGPPSDLSKAEELILNKKLAEAEPLLRKVVQEDPKNYVAWFDLGFLENALGNVEESIAAYRNSVAAKPDLFESNL